MKDIQLENKTLRMLVSGKNAAVIGLESRLTGWKILDMPQRGLSFRLLVPLSEELRNNSVFGERQIPRSTVLSDDGASLKIEWSKLESDRGGVLDIDVVLEIALNERQAVFSMEIRNRSPYIVENAYCPYIGDLKHPPNSDWFKTFLPQYASCQEWELWPKYQNLRGYFGWDYPVQFAGIGAYSGNPMSPFILLRGENEGLYAGAARDSVEYAAWHTELRPGWISSIDCRHPDAESVSGKDVHTRFAAVHMPFIAPGDYAELLPIALEPYVGSWDKGTDIHRARFAQDFSMPVVPGWAMEPHSWLQLHINSPEDELRIRFSQLPEVGRECAKHSVKAIQLVGWNYGGQDQGNPSHSFDPRLGTFEELKSAIAAIRGMGVKVILFAKFTWADRATEWFRKDLIRMAVKDPYGDYYCQVGYKYQTATQAMDINTKRLIPMCFLYEGYLQVCEKEFEKILDLEPDGFLFDECQHHTPALLCFDESHGHRYGAPVYANDNVLIERFAQLSSRRNPDFLFAGEACYDREMAMYHLSYHRSESKSHVPLSRYSLPSAQFMTAVTGFNDRNMINQCLLYRYIISYEPYNFKGRLEDFPLTLGYGKKMDVLRTELRDYFWDGEYRHEDGVKALKDGKPHHPYAVYRSAKEKRMGVVVANYDEESPAVVTIGTAEGVLVKWRLVDDSVWHSFTGSVEIPPESCVVIL